MQFAQPFDNQPLHNPYPQEIPEPESTEAEPQSTPDPNQLSFDLQSKHSGMRERFENIRHRANRREVELELIPFWRSFSSSFAVISTICLVLFMGASGLAMFSRLPPQIPFYYNSVEARWEQADKVVVLFIPIGIAIINALLLRFIYDIYSYDKRLSMMLSWTLTIINLLLIIATGQIFSLIL